MDKEALLFFGAGGGVIGVSASTTAIVTGSVTGASLLGVMAGVWLGACGRAFGVANAAPHSPDEIDECSSVGVRLAMAVGVLRRADCGCLYCTGGYRGGPPERKDVADGPEESVWRRRQNGARVRYECYHETMRRCEHCGRHVHGYVRPSPLRKHVVWEDEPLPDAVDDDGSPVVEIEESEVFV